MTAMDTTPTRLPHPAIAGLALETGFDNANPMDPGAIRAGADGAWEIRQTLEPGAPEGYSFHLHLALVNATARPVKVALVIIWAEAGFDFCHDYLYVGYDDGRDWRMLSTASVEGRTALTLVVPPGRHRLCCHPKFDTGDYAALLDRYAGRGPFARIEAARSAEGRPIAGLRCGNPAGRVAVITTRAHAYETAGAHCMAGWFRHVLEQPAAVAPVLERLNLLFFPMINPDAVARGHCCLAPTGVNFGNELALRGADDAGAKGLAEFIVGLKPAFYLDMHNNTGPHLNDSFRTGSPALFEAFMARAPDRSRDQKVWGGRVLDIATPYMKGYLPGVCQTRFGTVAMITEFPWYTRRPPEMEDHGREFFNALLPLLATWPAAG